MPNVSPPKLTGTLSNTGRSTDLFYPKPLNSNKLLGSFYLHLSGNWVGGISLFRKMSDTAAWILAGTYTSPGTFLFENIDINYAYKLVASTLTSGTVAYNLYNTELSSWDFESPSVDPVARTLLAQVNNNYIPNVYNYNPTQFPNFRAQLAKAMQGLGRAKIAFWSCDSTTVGAGGGSGGTTNINGAYPYSAPSQLAAMFTRAGYTVSTDTMFNDNGTPTAGTAGVALYNPKVAFEGAGWTRQGRMYSNSTTTDKIIYTPANSSDTVQVGYYQRATGGAVTQIYDNGVASGATFDTTGTTQMTSVSRTRVASTNTWSVARVSGANCNLQWIECYHSTATHISIMNMGVYGTTTTNWAADNINVYDRYFNLDVWLPNLVVINLGINDCNTGIPLDTFVSNMQTLITKAKSINADVLLVRHQPINLTGSITLGVLNAPKLDLYKSATYALAQSNNVPLMDLENRQVSYTLANSLGFMDDAFHPTKAGYFDIASAYFSVLKPQ